jgi:hypothetical protein
MNQTDITRIYKKKGAIILLQRVCKDTELTSKDMIEAITGEEKHLKDSEDTILKLKNQIENSKTSIESNKKYCLDVGENLKNLKKFEEWALGVQESKLKAIVEEIKSEIEKKVREGYTQDDALDKEQNEIQMFAQYREYMMRHSKIIEEIAKKVYTEKLQKPGYLKNPFKAE